MAGHARGTRRVKHAQHGPQFPPVTQHQCQLPLKLALVASAVRAALPQGVGHLRRFPSRRKVRPKFFRRAWPTLVMTPLRSTR